MADPYLYINATGVIIPDTSLLLAKVQQEFRDAFQRQDLVVTADTPQGVLIVSDTAARAQEVANNAIIANQINPNYSGGIALDAILALTGMERTVQKQTIVKDVELTGIPGTVITQGAQAQTESGDVFMSASAVILDGTGNAIVDFVSMEYGPIPCVADSLTQIVQGPLGWETVTNPNAGILGATTQNDEAAKALRNNTLAFQGLSLAEAITSALYATAGVTSLAFRENITNDTVTIDGVNLVAHSVYACVRGGTDTDVAAALLENKSSGANWNGDVVVNLVEPASGQTYGVKFDRPDEIGILIKVTASGGTNDQIIGAILDYANGLIAGEPGFVVGGAVSPFEISGAINIEYPSIYVKKVELDLAVDGSGFSTDEIAILISQIAHTQTSYITIVAA